MQEVGIALLESTTHFLSPAFRLRFVVSELLKLAHCQSLPVFEPQYEQECA